MKFSVVSRLAALALACLSIASAAGLSDGPIISEFLASNSNGLMDEDGSREDWLEIHNPTAAPISLNGWYLTGNAADLDKWKFPNVTLPANGYLVVFASNKNRRNPNNPLHTNFKLGSSGEYLALVKPDKTTIAWEYSPTFPAQLQNVSYGVTPLQGDQTTVVGAGAAGDYQVPVAAPPADWKLPSFNAGSGWASGLAGIGYANPTAQNGTARILFVVDTAATGIPAEGDQAIFQRLTQGLGHEVTVMDDGAVQAGDASGKHLIIVSSSVIASQVNSKLRGAPIPVINCERSLSDDFRISDSGAALDAQTSISLTAAGAAHPLGAGLPVGSVAVRTVTGIVSTADDDGLAPGAVVIANAANGAPAIAVVDKNQLLNTGSAAPGMRIQFFLSDDGLVPCTAQGIALFDAAVAYTLQGVLLPSKYAVLIGTDVKAAMENTATSALLRHTFTPDSVSQFASLALKMKYDDGFVAWLNGTEIARRNAPTNVTWNSSATADRPVNASLAFEEIDISQHLGLLVSGQPNVLAIQGLNQSSADGDFLILPELIARGPATPFYQFYTIPTPGAPNNTTSLGVVPDVVFSAERGYFEEPFSLALSVPLAATEIRYTTDGSAPTATTGTIYTSPLAIADTTVVRAAGFRSGYSTLKPETKSYLKLSSIIRQPPSITGWPRPSISAGTGLPKVHDYEMDPEIVNDPAYAADLVDGLKDLPIMSVVVKKSDMWDANGGVGFYRSDDLEKAASVEFIHPDDPAKNVQADCGIQGHSHDRMKRSLRLSFSSAFGESKFDSTLFTDTPLNPGKGNTEVDNIILRAGNNRSFARVWNPTASTYTEDEWYRSTQIAMGGPGSPGRFVHLYINGLYWGLYNAVQRPDADFASDLLGGTKGDWHSVNHSGTRSGDATRWDYLKGTLTDKNMSVPANYAELRDYLDPGAFIDYLLCAWYSGMADWPENNWWGGNSNNPAGPFRFFTWDGETSWGSGNSTSPVAWVHPNFRTNNSANLTVPAVKIWHAARANPDFMMLVADRLQKHLSSGGALSTAAAVQRWDTVNNHIRDAIIAESARWGDVMQEPPSRRDVEWQNEVTRIRNLMTTGTANGTGTLDNGTILRNAMRGQGYYPAIDPPVFAQNGGDIPEGFGLDIANPNAAGSIYYTLDGSDPRLPGGSTSASANLYSGPVPIGYSLGVKARVKNGNVWSALADAAFVSPARSPLRISEVMFNPTGLTPEEAELGFTGGEDFEFLEFHNTGSIAIDLTGCHFANGVTFTFGDTVIPAGGYLVLAKNPAAFAARHGTVHPFLGPYDGNLSNTGERIRLRTTADQDVIDFTFDDVWHPLADNDGHSLVPLNESSAPETLDAAGGWRASTNPGGSPGEADPPPMVIPPTWQELYFSTEELLDPLLSGPDADFDQDGLSNVLEHAFGTDPKSPDGGTLKVAEGAIVSRGAPALVSEEGVYHFLFARRKSHEEDGWDYLPQTSNHLDIWTPLDGETTVVAEDDDIEILSLPFPVPNGEPQFFRLEVIAP